MWHQHLANLGYIVISIDNRGANVPRGREWRKCIYGEIGTINSLDQSNGVKDLARQYSFIDASRIGVTGWSGGGSQTLNCMFRYPDVFHTGIAVAFVATIYGLFAANLLLIPLGTRIKLNYAKVFLSKEVMLEGVLAIQAGESPALIERKLRSFIIEQAGEQKEEEQ